MTTCVFPGSFDPVTNGHFDLIQRASRLFDRVTVTVMINIRKRYVIPADKRVDMLRKLCEDLPNVYIDEWDGLLADYMRKNGERIVLRGIRSGLETQDELTSASINRLLNDQIETILLPASPRYSGISSSAVKEIYLFGGDISSFVPVQLTEEISGYLSKQ